MRKYYIGTAVLLMVLSCRSSQELTRARTAVSQLSSSDAATARRAVADIMKLREAAVPHLFEFAGDGRPFAGGPLGNTESAHFSLDEWGDTSAITNEAAALYLINAIYHGTLNFAQSALLVDNRVAPDERRAANTRENLTLGWAAAVRWRERLEKVGMAGVRRERMHPLSDAPVAFW